MKYLVLVLLATGCAGSQVPQTALPRAAASLEAIKDLWRGACRPEELPVVKDKCEPAKDGIYTLIDIYDAANAGAEE